MDVGEYLSVLNPEQSEAVIHEGSPLLILAGAGSGKTRVITTKIAYLIGALGEDPYSILAVTFTKKAASEMAERARALENRAIKTQIRTFHSFGAWFLRTHAEEAGIDSNFTVYDEDDMVQLLTKAVPSLSKQQAKLAVHKIARAKDYCLSPQSPDLSLIEANPEFAEIYAAYETRLRETGNVDFGDLIMLPVVVMESFPAVKQHMHYRFKTILVDEYQDSNVAQFKLIQQLKGENTYLCVVGDDDQSIYKFRGAEVQNILTFQEHFSGTKVIKLERNYRSTAPILKIANDVVKNNTDRLGKNLISERGDGRRPKMVFLQNQDDETAFATELIELAHKKGCPYSDWAILYRTNAQSLGFETAFLHRKIPYTVVGSLKFYQREEIKDAVAWLSFFANQKDELAFRRIINKPSRGIGAKTQDKIISAYRLKRVAQKREGVLEESIIDACRENEASLSKKAKSGINFFVSLFDELMEFLDHEKNKNAPVLKDAVAMTASNDLFDGLDVSLEDVVDTASKATDTRLKAVLDSDAHLSSFVEKLVKKAGLIEYHSAQDEIAGTQRVANLQELANAAVLYPNSKKGLIEFLDHIELDRSLEHDGDEHEDAVTLITLHNTKGLEFSRVIMTGMEKGIFPRRDKTEDELEEERRLCYVGITRAKNNIYLTCCDKRRIYGRTEFMEPSPFLLEIDPLAIDVIGKQPPSVKRLRLKNEPMGSCETKMIQKKSAWSSPENKELASVWKKGMRVYHDEWGYGAIVGIKESSKEFVIRVLFDNRNGDEKLFMPKYQSHTIMLCKE